MNRVVQDFMKATCRMNMTKSEEEQGISSPPLELPIPEGATLIPLPAPGELKMPAANLRETIEHRRTLRRYSEQPLSLAELAYLLWLTQGVKEITARQVTMRTVPSAGARHALETYLLVNNVDGVTPGLYRFAACEHVLVQLHEAHGHEEKREEITHACSDQRKVYNSAVTFLWVAVPQRMTWRYVERGYRYLHLDAGHVCQNLYLAAESINCGVCAIAAYDDELLNTALDLDGENLFVIYLASLGKR